MWFLSLNSHEAVTLNPKRGKAAAPDSNPECRSEQVNVKKCVIQK